MSSLSAILGKGSTMDGAGGGIASSASASSNPIPVMLRPFSPALNQLENIVEAKISPDRSLIAFKTVESDVVVHTVFSSRGNPTPWPGFRVSNVREYEWIGPVLATPPSDATASESTTPRTTASTTVEYFNTRNNDSPIFALVVLDHAGGLTLYPFSRSATSTMNFVVPPSPSTSQLRNSTSSTLPPPPSPSVNASRQFRNSKYVVDYSVLPRRLVLPSEDADPSNKVSFEPYDHHLYFCFIRSFTFFVT